MSDCYEKPVEGQHFLKCPSCKVYKPAKAFLKKLSRAQSKSMGYAGFNTLEVEVKNCSSCRKPPRKLKELSRKELLNKVATGDLNKYMGDQMIKRMDSDAVAAKRRAVNARWDRERARPWRFMVVEVGKEIIGVRHQQIYVRKLLNKQLADNVSATLTRDFLDAYMTALCQLRAELRLKTKVTRKQKPEKPESVWWPKHMAQETRMQVLDMWALIDPAVRVRMRQPLITRWSQEPDDLVVMLPDGDDNEDSALRLSDAKARLASVRNLLENNDD